MAAWLSQRSTILSTFSATAINYSTLSGSAITLNSTMISLGTSTNSVYTRLSQGNFNSSVSTSSWVSSLTGRVSTTTVAMSANAQYQLALSQSSISTSVMFTSTLGTSWSTLSGATGLPNPNETSYTTGAISGNGQYGVLGTSAGQLLVTSTFGQTFSGLTTTSPYVYLPFEGTTADQSGLSRTVTATGTFTYGTGTVGLYSAFFNNTSGNNTASFNIAVPWPGAPNFTITGWFNATSFSSGGVTPTIFATYSNSIRAIISNAGVLTVTVPSNGSTATLATSGTLITNRWYNYTFTFQTNGLCSFYLFYLDNALVGSSITNVGGTGTNALTPIYLGSNGSALNPFIGYMDDIDIYTIAMPFTTLAASVTPVPTIYLPLDTVPVSGTTGGTTLTVPIAPNNPTSATSYVVGSGAVNLNNPTAGGTATKYIRGTWTVPTSFTVNLWFNTQATNQYQMIFSALSGGVEIFIGNTNALVAYIPQGTTGIYSVATTATLSTNTWYNTTLIYQANGTSSFYLNNILVGNFTQSTGLTGWTQSTQFSLGTYDHNETYAFVGYIDDFKIYYTAIPFATLFPTLVSAPFIYLPLDTVPVIGSTTSGVLPTTLTVVGTPAPAPSFVMGSGAVRLTNIINSTPSQYIQGPLTFMPNYTITLWFNTQSIATGGYQIIYAMYSSALQIYLNGTNQLGIVAGNGIAGGTFISPFTNALTINTWYNVTVSYQTGGNYYFYLNNSLISSGPIGPSVAYTSNKFSIGIYDNWISGTSFPFNGYIDDVKIYNTAIPFTPLYPPQSFTSTAVSNSGQYMLATMANQGLYMSSNFGGTFSPVTGTLLNAVWSNAQISATGQYMLVNAAPQIVQPQLTGLASSGTALTTNPWQANGITWIASASSVLQNADTFPVSAVFDNTYNTWWACSAANASYTTSGNSSTVTPTIVIGVGSLRGDWVQIQSSIPLVMYSYQLGNGGGSQMVKSFHIVGSNDGTNWYPIQSATISGSTPPISVYTLTGPIIVNSSSSQTVGTASLTGTIYSTTTAVYTYFRIICISNFNSTTDYYVNISEWIINFQAGGQTYSTNYGATWSNQPALYSQQALMTVYNSPTTVAPQLTGLTGDTTTATVLTTTWVQNGISWTSNASNIARAGLQPWVAFNNVGNATTGSYSWASLTIYPTPTSITNISSPGPGNYTGEWLEIYSSVPLIMYSYNFACGGLNTNFPKEYFIVGSRDNSTWFPIQLVVLGATNPFTTNFTIATSPAIIVNSSASQTINGGAAVSFTPTIYATTANPYNYFRIIAKTTFGGPNFELNEWYVNFTPPSTTAASMTYPSTTLALSESGQYALSATVSNPVLLGELNFELSSPNQYDDSIAGGLTNPTAQGTGITISSTAKVGTKSLSIVNTAGQSGSNSYVSYTLPSFFAGFPNAFTISAWIRPSSLPGANTGAVPIHMGFVGLGGGKTLLQMVIYPSGIFSFEFFTTTNLSTQLQIITVSAITLNVWTHVTGVIANGMAYVYINGVLQNSASYTGVPCIQTIGLAATTLVVGCVAGNYNQYAGLIDNLRIYNSALTPQQIQTIYANNVSSTDLIQISPSFSVSPQQTGLTTNTWNQGGVTWTSSVSSSFTTNFPAWVTFNNAVPNSATGIYSWASMPNYALAGTYNGSVTTAISGISPNPMPGEWLQIQSSVPLVMYSYNFAAGGISNIPKNYYIVGSNDGTSWFPIQTVTMGATNPFTTNFSNAISSNIIVNQSGTQTMNGGNSATLTCTTYTTNTTAAYTYFRIIANTVFGAVSGNVYFELEEWFLTFTGPTNTSLYNIVSSLTGFSTNTYTSGTIPGVITNSAISNTGQYMVVITNNVSGNNVYYSMNYGATFTGLQLGTSVLTSCAMSYDGSYMTIASGATVYTLNNNSTGFSVALGNQAGQQNQANNAIAIGNYAGYQNQAAGSIILNASGQGALGTGLNAVVQGFYVAPIASCVASSSQSFSILGYGTDNQVVQTGLTVLPDTGTFNLNAPVGSTTSGILSSRYYLMAVGDNQDANGINNNVYGPWYGVGLSGIPGFTNVPCLCGFYGVSMRSGSGYIILTEAGNVGIGTTNPAVKFQVGSITTDYGGSTSYTGATIVGPSVTPDLTSGTSLFSSLYVTTEDPMAVNKGGSIGFGSRQAFSSTNAMMGRITGTTNGSGISGDLVFEVLFNNTGRMYEKMRIVGSSGNVGIGITNPTAALQVNGSLAKSSGTFDIAHPLHPTTKRLVHSFIEGPRCDLIYRGTVALTNGVATVDINRQCTHNKVGAMEHGTFEALCANPDVFLQNRTGFGRVIGSIQGGTLTITCENNTATDLISWMVVAERADPFIKQWDRTDDDGYLITEYSQ